MLFLLGAACFLSVVSSQSFNANLQDSTLSVNLGLAIVSTTMIAVLLGLFGWLLTAFIRDYLIKTSVEIYEIGETQHQNPQVTERNHIPRKAGPKRMLHLSPPTQNHIGSL